MEFDDSKLEYESPLLNKLKQSPIDFKEPEGYFEEFNRKLNERIKYEQPTILPVKKQGIIITLFQPRYAIAAALLAAICVIGFKFIKTEKPLTKNEIAEVVVAEKIQNMDEEMLIDAIDVDMIDNEEMMTEEQISDDAIIEYLLENDVDINLVNEL